jgi:hypothetical protein
LNDLTFSESNNVMKTPTVIWLVLLITVAGFVCWLSRLAIPLQARIMVENDRDIPAQALAAHPVPSCDYYFIPQNKTPEVAITLN